MITSNMSMQGMHDMTHIEFGVGNLISSTKLKWVHMVHTMHIFGTGVV